MKIITRPQDGLPSKVVRPHKKQPAHTFLNKDVKKLNLIKNWKNTILTLLHKTGRISLNNGPIWKIKKLTGSWEQARPAGRNGSIICPPRGFFIRLGQENGLYLEHWNKSQWPTLHYNI